MCSFETVRLPLAMSKLTDIVHYCLHYSGIINSINFSLFSFSYFLLLPALPSFFFLLLEV